MAATRRTPQEHRHEATGLNTKKRSRLRYGFVARMCNSVRGLYIMSKAYLQTYYAHTFLGLHARACTCSRAVTCHLHEGEVKMRRLPRTGTAGRRPCWIMITLRCRITRRPRDLPPLLLSKILIQLCRRIWTMTNTFRPPRSCVYRVGKR